MVLSETLKSEKEQKKDAQNKIRKLDFKILTVGKFCFLFKN